MAQFIELGFFDPLDPYEKITSTRLFNVSLIIDPEWDEYGHISFKYDGKQVHTKGDLEKIKNLLK